MNSGGKRMKEAGAAEPVRIVGMKGKPNLNFTVYYHTCVRASSQLLGGRGVCNACLLSFSPCMVSASLGCPWLSET